MPSHFLTHLSLQEQVDYVESCQQRVAADTVVREAKTTLALTAGDFTYDLPADLIELEGIYNDTVALDDLTISELMAVLSGTGASNYLGPQGYAVVGRTLYVLPTPAAADTLTLVYVQRPPAFDSQAELELDGAEREILEALLDGNVVFDRGETEVGSAALARYMVEAQRRRAHNRGPVGPHLPVIGNDVFL